MKKIVRQVITTLVILGMFLVPLNEIKGASLPTVKAHAYLLYDSTTGTVLAKQSANKKIYPASTAKLMTAIVAIEHLDVNQRVKFTKSMAAAVDGGTSGRRLKVGDTYLVKQYLYMLLVESNASAAVALAKTTAKSVASFANLMNEKARELGCTKTKFDNPVGLDVGNHYNSTYTTANDFLAISKNAMTIPLIRKIVATKKITIRERTGRRTFKVKNSNQFYFGVKYNKNLFTIIGTKTGTTSAAGHVLVVTATNAAGREIILEFYGKSSLARMYKDIKKLLNYAYTTEALE